MTIAPPAESQNIPRTLATSQSARASPPALALASSLSDCAFISSTLEDPFATLSPSSTTPSIYVTCKVFSIVNAFRRRITRHVRERRPTRVASAETIQASCRDVEREAYRELDQYLGKKTLLPRKSEVAALLDSKGEPSKTEHFHRLLLQVSNAFDYNGNNLGTIAKDNRLFLDRKTHFDTDARSLRQLCQLFSSVKDLCEIVSTGEVRRTSAEEEDISDRDFDEISIANLLHLLSCLQSLLITKLLEECIGKLRNHAEQCHRDQTFWRCERWPFEYPDGKRPVSTTWPWCLRPSLAVLWGVCWMFYDRPTSFHVNAAGDLVSSDGQVIPQAAWRQYRRYIEQRQKLAAQIPSLPTLGAAQPGFNHSQVPIDPVRGHTEWQPRAMLQARHVPPNPLFAPSGSSGVAQRHLNFQAARSTGSLPFTNHTLLSHDSKLQGTYATRDLGGPCTNNNAYTSAPPSQALLPQSSTRPSFPSGTHYFWPPEVISGYPNAHPTYAAPPGLRANLPPSRGPARHLRSSPRTQDGAFSPTSSYVPSPQDAFPSNFAPFYPAPNQANYFNFGDMAAVADHAQMNGLPQPDTPMAGDPSDNTDPALHPRKRSYDDMNEVAIPDMHQHAPQPYPALPQQHEQQQQPLDHVEPEQHETELERDETQHEEGFEPRGSRSFKRGDPPVTAEGKFYCDYASECAGQYFDRKCEWSKHMDKHDRPYRCQHAQCAKLQGFTYSGGLLRHEREVHGKHGGPKAQLMCPYNECKRHSGKGFTRKENLNEHLRRVHDGKKPEEEPDANAAFQAGLEEAIRQTDMNQAVSGDAHETALPYPPPENQQYPAETAEMVKRRRIEDEPAVPSDNDDLRNEITRLQIESAQKDERIRQMETREAELATRLHHLEQEAGRVRQLEDMLRIHEAVRQVVPAAEEAQMQRPEGVV